ncbi:putative leucine-rich repeat receptor-like protein kinase IMK3 [Bidens hawaiensis]|uniref:putative leucine-rich repeat receptor-like protein kinase IMK3 n=1 Tax=Bidens hawaiensis TaxID=980011 RepID=UPI00404A3602
MASIFIFQKYPSPQTLHFHTHCFTFILHLLCFITYPFQKIQECKKNTPKIQSLHQKWKKKIQECKKNTNFFTFFLHLLISTSFNIYPFKKIQSLHQKCKKNTNFFTFILHPSLKIQSLHQKCKKNTLCYTLLKHLLICSLPLVVSSQSWDGIIVTQSDFKALQSFKLGLTDPNGFLKSWNDSGYGACSGGWEGIKCAQGQVIVIQLPWRGLGGQITSKIGQFQALRKLSLHDNGIGGSIPKELGFLPNLRGLQLYNNKFTGLIPATLGSCKLLQDLDFSNNSLVGGIPESLGNCTLLSNINLSLNSLSNSIPVSLTQSSSLMFLSLQYNIFSGVIPDSWGGGVNGTKPLVKGLTFDHNFFTGRIPVSLTKLTDLELISFSHNQFNDEIPVEIGNLVNLKGLDLSYNSINGSIPNNFKDLKSLTSLNLAHNNLTGQIPGFLGGQLNLASLNVSYNNLSGQVPGQLKKFDPSVFAGNLDLCGYSPSTTCVGMSPPESRHRKRKFKEILLIVGGALIAGFLLLCCIVLCCLLKKEDKVKEKDSDQVGPTKETPTEVAAEGAGEGGGKLVHFEGGVQFTADDLLCATAEIMGKSTYGTVYRATLVEGIQVAVKRLRERITKNQKELKNEVNSLGRIRHLNLLAMRSYYLGPKGEKLLVFDYMPKGSLASFLHARGPNTPINWSTRMRIMKGMTRGLVNLHTQQNIIHGNLTSNNVLLDDHLNPKIGDYGLSRLMTTAANLNVVATAGALGYRAPELSKLKKANTKTDMYSLGVIMLELLTGKSPGEVADGVDLPQWVASIVKEEWTNEVFDLDLMKDATAIGDELLNTLKLALHCVDPTPSARPEAQLVLQQLEQIRPETATSSGDEGCGPSTRE